MKPSTYRTLSDKKINIHEKLEEFYLTSDIKLFIKSVELIVLSNATPRQKITNIRGEAGEDLI